MMDCDKLVKALRCKRDDCEGCDLAFLDNDEGWMCRYAAKDDDAADAIEALQEQLPKQGEWIKHPEVKNIYGGVYIECPLCGEKYVVQYVSDEKFCRNCGADLRAKMEVQE